MGTGTGQRNKPAENYKSMVKWLRLLETPVSQRICLFYKNHFNKSTFFYRTSILRPHVHYFSSGFIMVPVTILFHLRLLRTLG